MNPFPAVPQVMGPILIAAVSVLLFLWPFRTRWLRYVFRLWYFALCVDFCFNTFAQLWGQQRPGSDWTKFQVDVLGWGAVPMAILTWALWLVFVLSHFVWSYRARWNETRPATPATFFSYRWMAVPLFLLSATAVLLSITVTSGRTPDPIVKSCPFFYAVLVGQILASVWFVVYFILGQARRA